MPSSARKKILKKCDLCNAFASNEQSFLYFFYIAILDLSEEYFNNRDQWQRTILTQQEYIGLTLIFDKI